MDIKIALSMAQRAVVNMIRERGGSVRMTVNEKALGGAGLKGVNKLRELGLVTITPLVGTSDECDIRFTSLGTLVATQIYNSIKGI